MRITLWTEYGVLISIYLARKESDEAIGAAEISYALNIPIEYTQQILQRLRKGEIVESVRGPKGGYKLSRPSNKIDLKQILIAAEGKTFEVICETKPITESCGEAKEICALHDIWHDLKNCVDDFLMKKNLAEIAKISIFDKDNLVHINQNKNKKPLDKTGQVETSS